METKTMTRPAQIATEVIDAKNLPAGRERGSMYGAAIVQALKLKQGEGLKVTNPSNTHLRNTLYQLVSRKGLKAQLGVIVSNKETYLIKR
ncbi:MAG: hypothetical protein KKD44_29325 [Proteobacteria bacterium]|nr:hypothetical protein [Pseudomonadota bacterium]